MASPDEIISFFTDHLQIVSRNFRGDRIAVIRVGVMTVEADQFDWLPVQSDAPVLQTHLAHSETDFLFILSCSEVQTVQIWCLNGPQFVRRNFLYSIYNFIRHRDRYHLTVIEA